MTVHDQKFTCQHVMAMDYLTETLFTLRLSRDAGFRFKAGQFVRLGLRKPSGSIVWRPYSMVSAPHDEFLDFFSVMVPDGEFSPQLSHLQVGDEVLVEKQATGFLTLERFPDGRDLWLLATGTGVAPFISILQDFEVWQRYENIVLVYSVRKLCELAYQTLLAELPKRPYLEGLGHKLIFLPVVTQETIPSMLGERITQLLDKGELERAAGLVLEPEHSRIMLCGNPQMIEDTRHCLEQRNLLLSLVRRPGQVAVENYW